MAAGSLYIDFVMQVGFGVVQFLGEVLPKFLRKFWWNFPKAGPIAGAVLSVPKRSPILGLLPLQHA